jgi:hypothetical protein
MNSNSPLNFKIADAPAEFEQIHRLNYQTFAEEIPQHGPNPECRLMDRFHHENTYLICLDGDRLVGMMALRGKRPFSLDLKLENLDSYLPPGRRIVEVRLLSVARTHRNSQVLPGLLKLLAGYGIPQGYNLAIISGTLRQRKLYRHLGFIPFGPLVGSPPAQFQPMYLTLEVFEEVVKKIVPSVLVSTPASTPGNG